MNNKDLLKVYSYAEAIFSSFKMPVDEIKAQTTALVWLKFLKPYPLDVIYSAIDQLAKTNDFINIVKISELCKEFTEIQAGTHNTADSYLNEVENAVLKASSGESARNAYDNLSPFCKSLFPGSWSLGKMYNEGFEYHATRIKQLILDKLRSISMEKSMDTNTKLLNLQNTNKLLGDKHI